jgi:FixJ family two-component response regulator
MSDRAPIVYSVDTEASVHAAIQTLSHREGWRSEGFVSARQFLDRPRSLGPSCLVLENCLPDATGLELQARITDTRDEMPVIFVANCADVATTVRAMRAGAVEFLTKPFDPVQLSAAIRTAIERSRVALAREAGIREIQRRYLSLSRREREVMELVVSGHLNKQVGSVLGISAITVKAHRARAMRKMGARSLARLVDMATWLTPNRTPQMYATSLNGGGREVIGYCRLAVERTPAAFEEAN